jgi:hypothetical protein
LFVCTESGSGSVNEFLNARRMRAWCIILACALSIWAVLAVTEAVLGAGGPGADLGFDFTCFRAAGILAAKGLAASAYQPEAMAVVEHAQRVFPDAHVLPFFYPPTYLLLCLPLALVPYWPALVLFLAAGFVPLVLALRRLEPLGFGWLPILAFPGMLVSAGTGQNGFLSAACFAGFMLFGDTRPWLAGACLGLLASKPHLAVLAPLTLVVGGRWRSLAGAALTFTLLAALSVAVFGMEPWIRFLEASRFATREIAMADQTKFLSVFIAVRLLGGPAVLAAIAQAAVALAAIALALRFIRRRPGAAAEGAALTAAAVVCTPYLADYDLACLAPPLAFAAARAIRIGWAPYEKLALLAVYMLPLLARGIAARTTVQIAPVIMAVLLFAVVRPAGNEPA